MFGLIHLHVAACLYSMQQSVWINYAEVPKVHLKYPW